jgi:hypothetical protein
MPTSMPNRAREKVKIIASHRLVCGYLPTLLELIFTNWDRLVYKEDRYVLIWQFSGLKRSIIGKFIEYGYRQFESSCSKMARSRHRSLW